MKQLPIRGHFGIPLREIELSAVRSEGPGGQHVNRTASAIALRWHFASSSVPGAVRDALAGWPDQRITRDGAIVLKAQNHRHQKLNRAAALERLADLVRAATARQRPRRKTRPTRASGERRLGAKKRIGETKRLRRPPSGD